MIIISKEHYVAGIFEHRADALRYLDQMPNGTCTFTQLALTYPFWLVEKDLAFLAYQTEAEANYWRNNAVLIYTIVEDYQPPTPWTDWMGSLLHIHLPDVIDED